MCKLKNVDYPILNVPHPIFWEDGKRVRMIFGDGNISVGTGHDGDDFNNILVLAVMDKPRLPIGVDMPEIEGKRSTDVGPAIELEFKKPESVQVVIDALETIKQKLAGL